MGIPICSSRRRRFPLLLVPDHIHSQIIEEEILDDHIHSQIIEEEILDEEEEGDDTLISIYNNERRSLYCILLEKPLQFQIELPPQFHKTHRFCGSSHGWLFASIVDDQDILHISLFHPINNNTILNLPPITQNLTELPSARENYADAKNTLNLYHNHSVHKAVLSCDPSSNPDDYVVMVIYDSYNRLAFIRPGTDSTWTFLDRDIYRKPIVDVIYYKGKVFAVDCRGRVVCCEAVDHNWTARMVSQGSAIISPGDKKYLVESLDGDLLQVDRDYDVVHEPHNSAGQKSTKFQVFKLMKDPINDFEFDNSEWMEIKSIGDCALFLGGNESISIRASDFDGCRSNSIYFTSDGFVFTNPVCDQFGYTDMGVYHLEDETIQPIHYNTPGMSCQTPIWITTVKNDLN